ncbi:hypothetical protein PQO03_12490 [Lentisphaera profundi]|uniref:N-sulphoglucosamine sulphohydrolase C-terminal domain-containing protein n=1 Tax=Lentisphaera profundi TaxID=1658616 RepID=A0ABY7VWS6_9BACT|nr:hypothetical protein [Lentisphaera profundi]WDE98655.1 hypothetical protein PQO03_12490 [Lentisphaera profundi]
MNEKQAFLFAPHHVAEELYDLKKDPHEINNLAKDSEYASTLKEHQVILTKWIKATDDQGQYDETVPFLKGVLSQWSDAAVNPEYAKARK